MTARQRDHRNPGSRGLFTGIMLFALTVGPASTSTAQPAAKPAVHKFAVGKRMFLGEAKTVCVISGAWRDGAPFRYEAWDSCQKMQVRGARLVDYKGWKPRGRKGSPTVADIPPEAEVIEIGNDYSSVLIFRDRSGETREVLVRD